MHGFPFPLEDVLLFLVVAGALVPLLKRVRVNSVLAFLLIGLLVGPHGLGSFTDQFSWLHWISIEHVDFATSIAEIGVVLLLFLIGLEVSAPRLLAMRRLVFGLGGAQVFATGAIIAVVAGLLLQNGAAALVIGAALALSSTAIVLQLLSSSDRLGSASGRACLAVLLFQDLMVVPILLLVDLLGRDTDGSFLVALGSALGIAVLVVAVIMLAGQRLARPMLRLAASARMPEAFTAAVLLLIIVIAAVTAEAGLSLALGAFLAGLLLAETEFRHEIEVTLAPFKGLLLGLFFMSVGMGLDLSLVARELYWLGPALIAMLALKMLLLLGLGRAFGLSWPANVEMSLPMAPAGEFAFIIATAAGALGVLEPETAQLVIVLAGASMLLTPALSALGRRAAIALEGKLQEGGFQPDEATDLSGHIVIVGYGRVGRFLGTVLSERGTPHLAIDSDPNLVAKRREETGSVIYGDGKKIEILRQLGLDRAAGLAVTMNDPEANERVVEAVREAWPKLPIFARAHDTAHARKLMRIGANRATSEALEAGLDLSEAVLTGIGVPRETARAGLDRFRRVELESL